MKIVDSHFHWWPKAFFEHLCNRKSYPRAERDGKGGYRYFRREGEEPRFCPGRDWLDLDFQLAHMDSLGHEIDVVYSIGPLSVAPLLRLLTIANGCPLARLPRPPRLARPAPAPARSCSSCCASRSAPRRCTTR